MNNTVPMFNIKTMFFFKLYTVLDILCGKLYFNLKLSTFYHKSDVRNSLIPKMFTF